jgi:hypothetical protein
MGLKAKCCPKCCRILLADKVSKGAVKRDIVPQAATFSECSEKLSDVEQNFVRQSSAMSGFKSCDKSVSGLAATTI